MQPKQDWVENLPQTQEALKKLAKTPTSSTTIFAKRETEKKVKEEHREETLS